MAVNQPYKHLNILDAATLEALGAAGGRSLLVVIHHQLHRINHNLLLIVFIENDGHCTVTWRRHPDHQLHHIMVVLRCHRDGRLGMRRPDEHALYPSCPLNMTVKLGLIHRVAQYVHSHSAFHWVRYHCLQLVLRRLHRHNVHICMHLFDAGELRAHLCGPRELGRVTKRACKEGSPPSNAQGKGLGMRFMGMPRW